MIAILLFSIDDVNTSDAIIDDINTIGNDSNAIIDSSNAIYATLLQVYY
jgi:hypothetical protein